jgi:hypothetical protein
LQADERCVKVTAGVMVREGFSILESCLGRLISKNSVFERPSVQFDDIHEGTSPIVFSRRGTFFKECGRRERNEKPSAISIKTVMNRRLEIMVHRGVAYKINRRGPRTVDW